MQTSEPAKSYLAVGAPTPFPCLIIDSFFGFNACYPCLPAPAFHPSLLFVWFQSELCLQNRLAIVRNSVAFGFSGPAADNGRPKLLEICSLLVSMLALLASPHRLGTQTKFLLFQWMLCKDGNGEDDKREDGNGECKAGYTTL